MIKKIRNILVIILSVQVVIFTVQNIESDRSELNRISEFFFKSFEIDEVREFEIKDKLGNVQFKKTGKKGSVL